ncbi:MAG: hypothetical protein OXJ64_17440 [Boseongicola sp.]|nr:hypothetical protein [Boseongicola sp.]
MPGVMVSGGRLHVPGLTKPAVRRKGGNPHPDGRRVSALLKRAGARRRAITCLSVEVE